MKLFSDFKYWQQYDLFVSLHKCTFLFYSKKIKTLSLQYVSKLKLLMVIGLKGVKAVLLDCEKVNHKISEIGWWICGLY